MISTRRHLDYARGFLTLGMLAEAGAELAAIRAADQITPEVLAVVLDLHMQAKKWEELIISASQCARISPDMEQGWIYWAYALRELSRTPEAQAVLLEAEPRHGAECAVLHYNLACYACLLGSQAEARLRLTRAFQLGAEWQESALGDPDLQAMWPEIRSLGKSAGKR